MFDAFTSTWQNELFSVHKMSSVQMMCGVNFFSVVLTSSSLLQQGTFYTSLVFMSQFPPFVFDCVLLSLCSACGQVRTYALYLRLSYQVIKYLEWQCHTYHEGSVRIFNGIIRDVVRLVNNRLGVSAMGK